MVDKKGFINATAGYSLPAGSPFGKNSEKLLGPGQSVQVSVGYRPGRQWGMTASYTYVTNLFRKESLLGTSEAGLGGRNPWELVTTNCTVQTLLAGPMVTLPAGRVLFDLQLSGGYAFASNPGSELYTEFARLPLSMITPSRRASALAAGAGVTMRYKLTRWLAANASVQYLTANFKYDQDLVNEIQIGAERTTQSVNAHQPVGFVNLGAGLSFLF
ncbi:hypothetical protein GCM10027275_39450 [Rhabdobacter roseus]